MTTGTRRFEDLSVCGHPASSWSRGRHQNEQGPTRRIDDVRGIYEVKNDSLRLSIIPDMDALPTEFGAEHSEFKLVKGKLADEQLDALKQYSR